MGATEVLGLVLSQPSFEGTLWVLIMLYACLVVHAVTVLSTLRSRVMTSQFQLVLCLTTAACLRLVCFVGCYALWASSSARRLPPLPDAAGDVEFYAKVVVLLFDLPDFIVVSTYALLLVVWFEGFLEARRHWLDRRAYKRNWRVVYLCFNVLLYGAQTALYVAVFLDAWDVDGVRLLYVVLAAVTLAIPVAHFVAYVALSFRFSGFPMAPRGAKNRRHLSRVLCSWGVGRSLWGAAVALVVFREGLVDYLRDTPQFGTVFLVGLFLVTEICPFVLALDTGLLALVSKDNLRVPHQGARYAAVDGGGGRRAGGPPSTPTRRPPPASPPDDSPARATRPR